MTTQPAQIATNPDRIEMGDHVILRLPSGTTKLVRIKKEIVRLGKFGSFQLDNLIGKIHQTHYEILRDNQISATTSLEFQIPAENEIGENEDANTNQHTNDDASSQKLTQEEIEQMKVECANGNTTHRQLITSLAQNNVAFDTKTEFSKQKYIARKEAKFARIFCAVKTSASTLCAYWFEKNPEKILNLRKDTFSQLLTISNVQYGSRLLCVDETGGLIALGLVERMKGNGDLFCFHDRATPDLDILKTANLAEPFRDVVKSIPWHDFIGDPIVETRHVPHTPESHLKFNERQEKRAKVYSNLKAGHFDGVVIASRYNNIQIMDKLEPFLDSSSPVVIYAYRKESLMEVYEMMRWSDKYINAQLTESWMREYKCPVNLSGTHPQMMTSASGGYYVSAIFVGKQDLVIEKVSYKKMKADAKEKESKDI